MNSRTTLGGLVIMFSAGLAMAQSVPEAARITLPEVEVRAGASPQFPVTGKVRMGDTVQIKGRVGGFLEIVPPAGSLSWIPDRLVKQMAEANALELVVDEAPVRYGSGALHGPLEIDSRNAKVKRGARLTIRGEKVTHNGAVWWPIEPIPGESRFIPAEAVAPSAPAPVEPTRAPSVPAGPAASNALQAKSGKPKEWDQAEQAERDGRYDDAIRLYTELAQLNSKPGGDFTLAVLCQNRIRELWPLRRSSATLTSRGSGNANNRTGANSPYPPTPPLPGVAAQGRTGPAQLKPLVEGPRSSGPGYLRRAGVQIDGQTSYALENRAGDLLLYVTPEPGVNLEPHLNRLVELFGSIRTRGDVRGANHMYVSRVAPLK
jgi:hypothetical protein